MTNQQIQAAREVLMKYTLPDCLRPEFDGMSAYEVSKLMLEAAEKEKKQELVDMLAKADLEENEETDCPCGKASNHDGGDVEHCLEGQVIKNNL